MAPADFLRFREVEEPELSGLTLTISNPPVESTLTLQTRDYDDDPSMHYTPSPAEVAELLQQAADITGPTTIQDPVAANESWSGHEDLEFKRDTIFGGPSPVIDLHKLWEKIFPNWHKHHNDKRFALAADAAAAAGGHGVASDAHPAPEVVPAVDGHPIAVASTTAATKPSATTSAAAAKSDELSHIIVIILVVVVIVVPIITALALCLVRRHKKRAAAAAARAANYQKPAHLTGALDEGLVGKKPTGPFSKIHELFHPKDTHFGSAAI